jgi:ankyrin repeat protein
MQVLGEPVFFRLVRCNALHLLHLFLDKGADINAQNADGETALLYCARAGRTEMVKALLEMGADTEIQDKDGRTALMYAGQPKTIELLLNTKASVNHQDKEGNSVLFLSARASLLNKVQLLLEHDADITLKNKNNESFEKYGTCSSQTAEVQHIYLRCSEIYSEVRAAKAQLKITPNSNKNDSNNT